MDMPTQMIFKLQLHHARMASMIWRRRPAAWIQNSCGRRAETEKQAGSIVRVPWKTTWNKAKTWKTSHLINLHIVFIISHYKSVCHQKCPLQLSPPLPSFLDHNGFTDLLRVSIGFVQIHYPNSHDFVVFSRWYAQWSKPMSKQTRGEMAGKVYYISIYIIGLLILQDKPNRKSVCFTSAARSVVLPAHLSRWAWPQYSELSAPQAFPAKSKIARNSSWFSLSLYFFLVFLSLAAPYRFLLSMARSPYPLFVIYKVPRPPQDCTSPGGSDGSKASWKSDRLQPSNHSNSSWPFGSACLPRGHHTSKQVTLRPQNLKAISKSKGWNIVKTWPTCWAYSVWKGDIWGFSGAV